MSIKSRTHQKPHLKIQISQKDRTVLEAIKQDYGGWIEKGDGASIWVIYGKKARIIAEAMYPFLVVKKERVRQLALEREIPS